VPTVGSHRTVQVAIFAAACIAAGTGLAVWGSASEKAALMLQAREREAERVKALEARQKVEDAERDATALELEKKKQREEAFADLLDDKVPGPPLPEQPPVETLLAPSTRPWLEVQARFVAGNLDTALERAQTCAASSPPCRPLLKQLKTFAGRYRKIGAATDPEVISLTNLARKISGGELTTLMQSEVTKRADAHVAEANQFRARGEWQPGIALARRALALDPTHSPATSFILQCEAQAKELLRRAEDPGSASTRIQQYQAVMAMTTPGDATHQQAKRRLAQLSK
jgi:hypothetical protein